MLTFDEFFRKKRVDLAALEKAEPSLFFEFKTHYEHMGEKSFDHTKKYWFNKTRRRFPLAPEIKTEKPHIANPIAEQTITESLTEHTPPTSSPKIGFAPKFKAANVPKPAAEEKTEQAPVVEEPGVQPDSIAPAKPAGFVPRFKIKPKTEEGVDEMSPAPPESVRAEESSSPATESTPAKPAGFVPRFKMKPKAEESAEGISPLPAEPAKTEEQSAPVIEPDSTKPTGFVPRFKMKSKPDNEMAGPEASSADSSETENTPPIIETPPASAPEKKPAYKPRFVPPKPKE